jgi:O-antigen ligase
MSPPPLSADRPSRRVYAAAEWGLIIALLATFLWTTLCLGGYLAGTMAVAGPAVLGLGAWGGLLWAFGAGEEPRVINRAVFLPLPFLLYALASTLGWAPAQWLAWTEWLLWFQMWVVFALLLHFGRSRAHTWVIVGAFAVLLLAGVGMAIYQRFSDPRWIMLGRQQASQFWGRSSGMFGIPNSFAGLIELLLPVCLALLFSRAVRPGTKIICGWFAGLGLLGLVLTGSRGGWISLALALLLWPMLATRKWKKKVIGAMVVSVLVGGGLWLLYQGSDYARKRMEPFLNGEFELSRPKVWSTGARIWAEHPWMGSGAGSFDIVFDHHRPALYRDRPVWAHNEYLNTLCDHGLIGFALWAGAGVALMGLGWSNIRRTQRSGTSTGNLFGLTKWRLGLWLGLLAFALHLVVDFHTKIPALAYAAAIVMALVLREDAGLRWAVPRTAAWTAGVALALLGIGLAGKVARPLYQAEGLRFEARRTIDRYAVRQQGDLRAIAIAARSELAKSVRIDPSNGQAWADLSYVTALQGMTGQENRVWAGHAAELAAERAIQLCPVNAEFWMRKGVALSLQGGRSDAEDSFLQATKVAPKNAASWYAYAQYLRAFPERNRDAREAVATCLGLDPYYGGAESLRQQLLTGRLTEL